MYLAIAAVVVTLLATAAQMYMQYNQAQAEAGVAKRNARALEQQAAQSQSVASERTERMRRLAQQRLSEIRTGYAKAGVTPEGTPLLVESEAAKELELEALTEKWRGEVEGANYLSQAGMERWRARQIKSSLPMALAGTALQGLGSAAGGYMTASAAKAPAGSTGSTGKSLLSGTTAYA